MADTIGRTKLLTPYSAVDESNIIEVINCVRADFEKNCEDAERLYNYVGGEQAIKFRPDRNNPQVNNKLTENRALDILNFWTGYMVGSPIQYANANKQSASDEIYDLNTYMEENDKTSLDEELFDWVHICGIGFRMSLPQEQVDGSAPFDITIEDPRNTGVVYYSGRKKYPVMSIQTCVEIEDGEEVKYYICYTPRWRFKVACDSVIEYSKESPKRTTTTRGDNPLGYIPIVEGETDMLRQGVFEPVIPLLDAKNAILSDRVNGVEQFIQALLLLKGWRLPDGVTVRDAAEAGGMEVPDGKDVEYLVSELKQADTQTLVDSIDAMVDRIVAMPNRDRQRTANNTGLAIMYQDGWHDVETRAKKRENRHKRSERQWLKIPLHILRVNDIFDLRVKDISIIFTRRQYENIKTKADVFTQLTNEVERGRLSPEAPFIYSGLFLDGNREYEKMLEYRKQWKTESELVPRNTMPMSKELGEESDTDVEGGDTSETEGA